ncbi:MAG: hypothetical protein O7D86_06450 [Proteobacteria bacterium]|nr:hypothetical protein [Pseudomonadota bacterium]
MTAYNKTAFTHEQHVQQWQDRDLIVSDSAKAINYLSTINYYRLSGCVNKLMFAFIYDQIDKLN